MSNFSHKGQESCDLRLPHHGDHNAEYALSKLLQMGTVVEYESEFVVPAYRVTGISKSLLTSFYILGLKLTLQIDPLRERPITLGEAFALARITEARFEDERATTVIAKSNELNIAVQVQDSEETTLHTSNKVETMSTSMVATYEEHGSPAGKKGDLGAITSKGGLPDHMRASEKELAVLKSPLEQKSMFKRQERMLRRQEQQRLAKVAKIQRRIWDPRIKSLQDNTLWARNRPFYRVMAADSRSPRDGKHIEVLGYYNPLPGQDGGKRMGLNFDRV
nr:30S ribosomal protein S16-2, chloroplastic/mitochondrial [Tanacetum cinerariifolium]